MKNRNKNPLTVQRDSSFFQLKPRGPVAIILSCSDARAPAEIVFDQGLGDLFVIRVAGNVIAPSLVGSVEYAVAATQAKLVVVMGHTQCGAIQATYDAIEKKKPALTDNIHDIVDRIQPHIQLLVTRLRNRVDKDQLLRDAMRANVLASTNHLRHGTRFLEEKVRKKELMVVGAEYCIETGVVDFFDVPKGF